MISVLIPARNEFLLKRTIESTLAASQGEIEIIAVLDGYWPEPNIIDDDRVILIHYVDPVGQRHAINEAAKIAKGKYILKTDGHSTFDKGFDIKLPQDCEYDWTVIPRMYNLHAFDWVCKEGHRFYQDKFNPKKNNLCPDCKNKLEIEYIWKPRLHKKTDFMYFDKRLRVQYWNSYRKKPESKGDIVDVMNGQGACWFMHKDRFWELGGMDENHGSWGQVGVEVACKAWLSGGRHVVNKKTWFSHMFRTTGTFTFPYKIRTSEQEYARNYSRDLWTNDKWPLQKRKFQWLIDKFDPPTWNGEGKHEIVNYTLDMVKEMARPVHYKMMDVDELFEKRLVHSDPRKKRKWLEEYNKTHPKMSERTRILVNPEKCIENFFDSFIEFINLVEKGEVDIEKTSYHQYKIAHLAPSDLSPKLTRKGLRHAIHKSQSCIKLYNNIKQTGLINPLDMYLFKNEMILLKGYRRLVIIKALGHKEVPVRIWRSKDEYKRIMG